MGRGLSNVESTTMYVKHVTTTQIRPSGADIVGINCHFDPFVSLDAMKLVKQALDAAGLKPYLMVQPLAFMTPDASRQGFIDLPEFPFGECSLCCHPLSSCCILFSL